MITFENPTNLRQIIACSTLSERPVLIENYRLFENPQGAQQYEVKFMRMIQLISNGAKFEINKTGTQIKYYPGIITNNEGQELEFFCGNQRGISYYLEYLILLSIFGKVPLKMKLKGITNDETDYSVDIFQSCVVPMLKKFNNELDIHLKIHRRAFQHHEQPDGEVDVSCGFVKFLRAVQFEKKGLVKRIRGVCTGSKVAANLLNTVVSSARGVFNDFLPDVWIYTDLQKKSVTQGFGVSLIAETNNQEFIGLDEIAHNKEQAETLGERSAKYLLDEIMFCGSVDTCHQTLCLNLMALSEKKVSHVYLGRISPYTVDCVRIIKQFFGVTFKIEPEGKTRENNDEDESEGLEPYIEGEDQSQQEELDSEGEEDENTEQTVKKVDVLLCKWSCFGIGLTNISRPTF